MPQESRLVLLVFALEQTSLALNRWMTEAIILDADSIHDCIAALKPEILVIVKKQRDVELAERRERRKIAARRRSAVS